MTNVEDQLRQEAEDRADRRLKREILVLEAEVRRLDARRKRLEIAFILAAPFVVVACSILGHLAGVQVCQGTDARGAFVTTLYLGG